MKIIKGHSGSRIYLQDNIIFKYSTNTDRLYQQYLKQVDFLSDDYYITTPPCKWISDHIEMDFIPGYNFLEFCDISSDKEYASIVDQLIQFIKLNTGPTIPIHIKIFEDKFNEIYHKILLKPEITRLWHNLKLKCKDLKINCGYCMGDLSLSNVIIDKNKQKIWLIDFLNTFFDCPIQDIVKLKQSTQYKWESLLYDQFYNTEKVNARLKYFDDEINKYVDVKSPTYLLFQYFNLLRILPYTTDKKIRDQVETWIVEL